MWRRFSEEARQSIWDMREAGVHCYGERCSHSKEGDPAP